MLSLLLAVAWAGPPVVIVKSDDLVPYEAPIAAFVESLDQKPPIYDLRGRRLDGEALVRRLERDPPGVVFCLGAKAAWTMVNGLPGTPVVYASVLNPARYGLPVGDEHAIPATVSPEAYLSQFVGFFPAARRIGVLRGPLTDDTRVTSLRAAAVALGVELVLVDVESRAGVRGAFRDLIGTVDAIWLQPDREVLTADNYRLLVDETRRLGVPLLVETENMVRAGALFAVVPDWDATGRDAAALVRARLAGEPAPQRGDTARVVLNTATLEAAEIPFDRLLLDFVDEVVE
jgi:putative ABC transport system substrate-binding protein